MQKKRILAILGSTKKKSSNRAILEFIAQSIPDSVEVVVYDKIDTLPHFNPDLETKLPATVQDLRLAIENADAVLLSSPEYVFSLPGSLKNAIEWNVSTTLFSNKPIAIIIAAASGEKALASLSLIMTTLEAKIAPDSTLLLKGIKGKLNEQGKISDAQTMDKISAVVESLLHSID